MKRKQKDTPLAATACQLRSGQSHPFGALKGFVPLGTGEEIMYRQLREAIPVLDAAVGKLTRLSGGFGVKCRSKESQEKLEKFLREMPCGRGQVGIDSFLSGFVDSLLVYGRSVGELVIDRGHLRAVCWGDVTQLQVMEGENPLDVELWGPDGKGHMGPLPYQHLLLFTTLNPEAAHPYGVSIFRGMPFLADILMKIYTAIGCQGLSRVDFFVTYEGDEVVFNEINTLPGFTSISMYPKLFAASGVAYGQLIDTLLDLAMEAAE